MTGTSIVIVGDDSALPDLACEINVATAAAETAAKSAMEHALEVGDLLNQAKTRVAHGNWELWLTTHCIVALRTAQAYMRLAKHVQLLPLEKRNAAADLPVREAIRAISTKPEYPQGCRSIRVDKKDDAERTVAALNKSATAIRAAARQIGLIRELKGAQVLALRNKLTAAIDALDRLAQHGQEECGGAA